MLSWKQLPSQTQNRIWTFHLVFYIWNLTKENLRSELTFDFSNNRFCKPKGNTIQYKLHIGNWSLSSDRWSSYRCQYTNQIGNKGIDIEEILTSNSDQNGIIYKSWVPKQSNNYFITKSNLKYWINFLRSIISVVHLIRKLCQNQLFANQFVHTNGIYDVLQVSEVIESIEMANNSFIFCQRFIISATTSTVASSLFSLHFRSNFNLGSSWFNLLIHMVQY